MSLLQCENLSFSYDGREVLSGVNFCVEPGSYLCIVGENGTGKSTLMKGLLHLKKPSCGQIVTGDGLRAEEIGYLPQQSLVQKDFPASVGEVVLSGTLNGLGSHIFYRRQERQSAEEKMKLLGILPLKNSCYRELSGGQQQRVLLARALCSTRKLLLLDEPITGLDPVMAQDFYAMIREINRREHITIIMVSHDIRGAINDASHVLHLGQTQLFFGSTEDYRKSQCGKHFLNGEEQDD